MDCPDSGLKLGWVFGNGASWLRQGAVYCHGNEIMYSAGEVLVGYSKGEHKQRYGFGHTYEITASKWSSTQVADVPVARWTGWT